MNKFSRNHHVIDLMFPIALLFVFAASALTVLLLCANLYGKTTHSTQTNDEKYSALYYISEKLRHDDTIGHLHTETMDGITCLALDSIHNDQVYTTYIYAQDGALKELFALKDIPVTLNSGQRIMAITDLAIENTDTGIYRLTATDSEGHTSTLLVSERSHP